MTFKIFYSIVLSGILSGFFFIGPNNSYSILLPKDYQLVQIDSIGGGIVNHIFIGKDNDLNFEFSFSLSVVEKEIDNLLSPSTISDYEKDCKCKILESNLVEFSNFKGVQYLIEKKVENTQLGGIAYISKGINSKSINIVSMAMQENANKLSKNLNPILNTLVLNFD